MTGSSRRTAAAPACRSCTGCAKSAGMRAARPHAADGDHAVARCRASAGRRALRASRSGVMRGTSSAQVTEKCSAAFICSARLPVNDRGRGEQRRRSRRAAASASISGSRLAVSGRVRERLQRAEHARRTSRARVAARRCADRRRRSRGRAGPSVAAIAAQRRGGIRMRGAARARLARTREDRGERRLARAPDVERDDHRRRRDAVERSRVRTRSGCRRRYSCATRVP